MMVTKEKLKEELKPGLDYYDATPSIEECVRLFKQLEEAMQMQSEINQKLIRTISGLQERIEFLEGNGQKSALLLPPRLQ